MTFKKIIGGTFEMGNPDRDGYPQDLESPTAIITVPDFAIATTTISNADFAAFEKATGYVTDAEKYGWSAVFSQLVAAEDQAAGIPIPATPWWLVVQGADWRHPFGPHSTLAGLANHPVVHVSRNDAVAYCIWSNTRLPNEAEWEYAARGGKKGLKFPWGNTLTCDSTYMANTWQGNFPEQNTKQDGFLGTAPVEHFSPNAYGLYQMIGNVWEWCSNPGHRPLLRFTETSPLTDWDQNKEPGTHEYAVRGGSFLCHCSFCQRYRVDARNNITADSSASNIGFRVVADA